MTFNLEFVITKGDFGFYSNNLILKNSPKGPPLTSILKSIQGKQPNCLTLVREK